MRKFAAALLTFLCLCGAAAAEEKGALVMSIGTVGQPYAKYRIYYKPLGARTSFFSSEPDIYYMPGIFLERETPDFSDGETGMVRVVWLKPGPYEFFSVEMGSDREEWKSKEDFSLPFTIEAGKATYLGDFAAVTTMSGEKPVGGYFLVTDKHDRDIAIARRKDPALPPVATAIPDVDRLHAVFFKSKPPLCPVLEMLSPELAGRVEAQMARLAAMGSAPDNPACQ